MGTKIIINEISETDKSSELKIRHHLVFMKILMQRLKTSMIFRVACNFNCPYVVLKKRSEYIIQTVTISI